MKRLLLLALCACAKEPQEEPSVDGPTVDVSIEPEAPLTSDDLYVVIRADGTTGSWTVDLRWFKNGEETDFTDAELPAEATAKGEVWTVQAAVTDQVGTGDASISDGRTIINSAPGAAVLGTLPDEPRVGHRDLMCQVLSDADDPDGDAQSYRMAWQRNGDTFAGSMEAVWPGDTIPVDELVEGDVWRCTAQAWDGEAEGPPAYVEVTVVAPPRGFSAGEQAISDADRWFVGEDHMDFFGYDVAATSDVDGDGVDDLVASGHRMEAGGRNSGRTFVFSGADLALGTTTDPEAAATWVIDGAGWFDFAGYAVAGVGDTDGDGLSDLLVSTHNSDEIDFNSGSVSLFTRSDLGEPGVLTTSQASTRFIGESRRAYTGFALDGAGDVDGDGWPDVIIGAMGNLDNAPYEGKVYVVRHDQFEAGGEIDLGEVGTTLVGEQRRAYAGWAVSAAGDVDGDGLDDVLVGACGTELGGSEADEDEGAAYLVTGDSIAGRSVMELFDAERRWTGEDFHAYVGYDVAGVGDVDGDGRPDIAVSGLMGDSEGHYPGQVFLFFAGDLSESGSIDEAPVRFSGSGIDDQFGREVSGRGDVDGDGLADLLIGAMTAGFEMEGMAVLWLGAHIGTEGNHAAEDAYAVVYGEGDAAYLGAGLSSSGDFDGDGRADLAIGAHNTESADGRVGVLGVFFTD